jgi:hypothetical protein
MKTNLLILISNLVKNPITDLKSHYRSINRANSMGDALEFYIKDLFCGSLQENNLEKKNKIYEEYFSYFGNQNNPPDFILKNSDAIEVKKIESFKSSLALNSSPPKDKLRSDDIRITAHCKECDGGNWEEKDLFYAVGSAKNGIVKYLFFVQGTCYAADHTIYDRVHSPVKKEVESVLDSLGLEKGKTVELGKVKKVDPLGITELRIRGMWGIENPVKVFGYVAPIDKNTGFSVNAIMLKDKYLSFPEEDRKNLEGLASEKFIIKDIKVKSPNNPAKLLEAKLLSFQK